MSMNRLIAPALLVALLLGGGVLAGCGTGAGRGDVRATEPATAAHATLPDSWHGIGEEIRASRAQLLQDDQRGQKTPTYAFEPMLTDPVDIVAPGAYELRAGPIDPSLEAIESMGISFPPNAVEALSIERPSLPRLFEEGGQQYLAFTIEVTEVSQPYAGLRAWVQ